MQIDILTLFPDMFSSVFGASIMKRAVDSEAVKINIVNFRDYGIGKHRIVDDTPYGGGAGMLLKPEPIYEAMDAIREKSHSKDYRVILFDPAGKTFDQGMAEEFAEEEHLVFICGHYEGYDERIRDLVTDEISIGDYVLTGGELPAMVMTDAITRLLPGVLGNKQSAVEDSFSSGLLEHPHYTRPPEYREKKVPEVLMSGNHQLIDEWRSKESIRRTYERRPDLLDTYELNVLQAQWLREIKAEADK